MYRKDGIQSTKEATDVWWFVILIVGILLFALFIDRRRKKRNNHPHRPTDPNAKPGDSSNYMMGDNRHTGSGQ
ncbi:hypothetical protein [Rossellomorea marisflavi]|uniref:hypothetical protein n=1 Tax=Rossellomorea marisflavi TaxID=189381 RepID=UPI0015C465F4|nr:hypothetical protein [Rossellomorea marisflavi]